MIKTKLSTPAQNTEIQKHMHRTLVIGLGNPLLGDDGFGWQVASGVEHVLRNQPNIIEEGIKPSPMFISATSASVEVECLSIGGLSLMEHMVGYYAAILIDAVTTGQQPIGHLYNYPLESLPAYPVGHLYSVHDTSLQTALQVGRQLGAKLPDTIWVIGVEIEPTFIFNENLTPPVTAAMPCAIKMVIEKLQQIEEEVL